MADGERKEEAGMMRERAIWEILDSDVLIVGGGFGGLWAALRAAECGSSVILVDKSFAGKSGHSYFASGTMMVLLPEDSLDEYVYDITLGNDWLVEQEMVEAIFKSSYRRLKDYESFGLTFRKDDRGYTWTRARGTRNVKNIWRENGTAAEEVTLLRKAAISRGVRFVDHVYVYDLAHDGAKHICGAIAMGVKDGRNYFFKAKSVVLATNSGSYRGHHLACELQGTGPFMGYDAGARIRNPEFHYVNIRPARHEIEGSGILPAIGARWVNARGAHFMEMYDTGLKDRAPSSKIVMAAAKEAMKGNAPVTIDVRRMSETEREKFRLLQVSHGWQPILFEKCKSEEGYDILRDNIEWQPAYEVNKLGLDTDLNGSTSLPGLFAAGMARTLGINPFTGWSIASCTWSGYTAGESASMYARDAKPGAIDFTHVAERYRNFIKPLAVKSGIDPDKLVLKLQKVLFPVDVLIIISGDRLKDALGKVMKLKEKGLPRLQAANTRTLIKSKETQTMLLSAEMSLKAALMRQETRENIFYREDFPAPDNEHWLKWILVEKGKHEEMTFSTRDIPFKQYRFRPDGPDRKKKKGT
jgi:succinate dehydrogenase/fumarate reductase flavoprotein subunit